MALQGIDHINIVVEDLATVKQFFLDLGFTCVDEADLEGPWLETVVGLSDCRARYAKLVYNGYWWSPEREMMQQMIDASQVNVNGDVRLKLYKGNVEVVGRRSENSLFDEDIATFEDDAGAYDQKDAEGFIKLNALRLRIAAGKK